jgi:SAM-dependent methyltransferase
MQKKMPFGINYDFASAADQYIRKTSGSEDHIKQLLGQAFKLAIDGRFAAAAESFNKLRGADRTLELVCLFHAGLCLLICEDLCSAARAFARAKKIRDDDYWICLFSGVVLNSLGLTAMANTELWTAHRVNPNPMINGIIQTRFCNEDHPERLALFPICRGSGLDVGCGSNKTHPDAIGVDLTPTGKRGSSGCEQNRISKADVTASGDHLPMFADCSLDYIVQRHNLEHYQDPIKALQEWHRLLKPGGILGMVVPDDRHCDTIKLDPTHKHVFTPLSLQRILSLMGGFEIVHMAPLLYHWSFICVVRKSGWEPESPFDYLNAVVDFEKKQVIKKADAYMTAGKLSLAEQCMTYLDTIYNSRSRIRSESPTADLNAA